MSLRSASIAASCARRCGSIPAPRSSSRRRSFEPLLESDGGARRGSSPFGPPGRRAWRSAARISAAMAAPSRSRKRFSASSGFVGSCEQRLLQRGIRLRSLPRLAAFPVRAGRHLSRASDFKPNSSARFAESLQVSLQQGPVQTGEHPRRPCGSTAPGSARWPRATFGFHRRADGRLRTRPAPAAMWKCMIQAAMVHAFDADRRFRHPA